MKLMKRNLSPVHYCLYSDRVPLLDTDGYATGYAQVNMFGNLESYDKVLITDDMMCPIDENTVLFVDKAPEFKDGKPLYDYTVRRVAKSLNAISYAVSKVKVS